MGPSLKKLLSIASAPLLPKSEGIELSGHADGQFNSKLHAELSEMLRERAGFYAFESALYVRPPSDCYVHLGLQTWNSSTGWREVYGDLTQGLFFFAEDLFGVQFAIAADGVITFDPETGERTLLADDLDGWANALLTDYPALTGQPLAHAWQVAHGALKAEVRLMPKRPFVLGGEFSIDNLAPVDSTEGMRFRGDLAIQLRDLPDGSEVRLRVIG
jgi:hypothetical protein